MCIGSPETVMGNLEEAAKGEAMPWATGVVVWIIRPTVSTKGPGEGRLSVTQRGVPWCNTASEVLLSGVTEKDAV